MRKLYALCLSFILVIASVLPVFADGQMMMYDPYSGSIILNDNNGKRETVDTAVLTSNCTYSKVKDCYMFRTPSASDFNVYSTVFDGMMVQGPVSITTEPGTNLSVYLNGEELNDTDFENISDKGSYLVRDNASESKLFSFTIIGDYLGSDTTYYEVPYIFYISDVYLDGNQVTQQSNVVDLSQEGHYQINYHCDSIGETYVLDITADHTAPELQISGVSAGVAKSTVTIGPREDHSEIVMTKDGEFITFDDEIKNAGYYTISYSDQAGNTTEYAFTVNVFFDGAAWVYVGLIAAIIIAAVVYMIIVRKKFRTC